MTHGSDGITVKLSPKGKAWAAVFGCLLISIALLDFVVLKGERVLSKSVDLRSSAPLIVELTRTGEPHLFEIRTKRRVRGETTGLAIEYRLVDPNGIMIDQNSELVSRKNRYIAFTPAVAGPYTLEVEAQSRFSLRRSGSADIHVYVNDRRIGRHIGF